MNRFTQLLFTTSVFALAACENQPSAPFPAAFAKAERSCGAADGPAVTIFLSDVPFSSDTPEVPYVHIWIQQSVMSLAGKSLQVPAEASATFHRSGPAPEGATSGTVVITSVAADTTVSGTVSVRFGDLEVSKQFTAPWRSKTFLCG
jgi:hypothetical protein